MDRFSTVAEIEQEAMGRLTRAAKSYYTSGANNMVSLRDANRAFGEI